MKRIGFVFGFFVLDPIVRGETFFLGLIHRFEDMENGNFNFTIQNERVAFSPETVCPIFLYMENGQGVRGCIRINRIEPVTDELVNGVLYHRNAKVYFDLKYRKTQVNKDIF